MIPQQSNQQELGLLTVVQASQFLNLKISRIRHLVFTNKIPSHKIGRTVMFMKSELLDWVISQRKSGLK